MDKLVLKKCVPCEGGIEPLNDEETKRYLARIDGWKTEPKKIRGKDVPTITKQYKFRDFREGMGFLKQVEEIAESEGHHPDFCVHYNKIDFRIWTHAIGGLHENDFILAAKIDQARQKISEK